MKLNKTKDSDSFIAFGPDPFLCFHLPSPVSGCGFASSSLQPDDLAPAFNQANRSSAFINIQQASNRLSLDFATCDLQYGNSYLTAQYLESTF